jgi:hypothetical protein
LEEWASQEKNIKLTLSALQWIERFGDVATECYWVENPKIAGQVQAADLKVWSTGIASDQHTEPDVGVDVGSDNDADEDALSDQDEAHAEKPSPNVDEVAQKEARRAIPFARQDLLLVDIDSPAK